MPELPEVETIVRALHEGGRGHPAIIGHSITKAFVLWKKSIASISLHEFQQRIVEQRIINVSRRGKFIIIQMEKDHLLIHLRMSGDIRVELIPPGCRDVFQLHDRVVLNLNDGWRMAFNDPRKFGRMWLVNDPKQITQKLGNEPFDPILDRGGFYRLLATRKRQIKPLLLDQTLLSGIGNIYSDEALHKAKIHPLQQANLISERDARTLLTAIRAVLRKGIKHNGASIDWVYRGGEFQNHFRVYQRTGEPCQVCGTLIEKMTVGQRSTHFCPECQVLTGNNSDKNKVKP